MTQQHVVNEGPKDVPTPASTEPDANTPESHRMAAVEEFSIKICEKRGLTTAACSAIVRIAGSSKSSVMLSYVHLDGKTTHADASSIFDVLQIPAQADENIKVRITGEDRAMVKAELLKLEYWKAQ